MPSSLATYLCALFVLWLFVSDAKRHPRVSPALWLPIAWACIIGSRSVSFWLGWSGGQMDASGLSEDAPVDKLVYAFLIFGGLVVLIRRGVTWSAIFEQNKWLCIFILYLGLSAIWSPDLIVSTKRWLKELGHVVMILVIFTDREPLEAVRAFLARCVYLLIPLSVLVVKYYPWISRTYDAWTWEPSITGICQDKNIFGMTLFFCTVSLAWMLLGLKEADPGKKDKTARYRYIVLLVMAAWLLSKAHSATALTCSTLAIGVLVGMKMPSVRYRVRRLGTYLSVIAIVVLLLQITGAWDALWVGSVKFLGRDPHLTGRAPIWKAVLKEDIDPLIGTGFYSFWSVERARRVSQACGLYYLLNEAHDGYIETYLNSGLIGLTLLITMIASAAGRIKQDAIKAFGLASLRLAFLIAIVLYNVTESAFDRLTPVRFALLFAVIQWRMPATSRSAQTRPSAVPNETRVGAMGYSPQASKRPA